MTAVLSLGVVGYGVALTFLIFGAPDLAMTQFSVETLTAVIYVLVFRHFRALGALPRRPLVRARDAADRRGDRRLRSLAWSSPVATTDTVAAAAATSPRFGPGWGTGATSSTSSWSTSARFDTLGEITVLATAAIGVRGCCDWAADGKACANRH